MQQAQNNQQAQTQQHGQQQQQQVQVQQPAAANLTLPSHSINSNAQNQQSVLGKRGASRSPESALDQQASQGHQFLQGESAGGVQLTEQELQRLRSLDELLCPSATCMICERNIGKSIKVRDMDSSENVVYCLDCHMRGNTKEGLNHKADCTYYIYDSLKWPLIKSDWTVEESLRLFQGIMKCGMGNWTDVSTQFLHGNKSEAECEELYLGFLYKAQDKGSKIAYDHVLLQRDFQADSQITSNKLDPVAIKNCQDSISNHNQRVRQFKEQEAREFDLHGLDSNALFAQSSQPNNTNTNGDNTPAQQNSNTVTGRLPKNNQRREANLKKDCQDVLGFQPKRGDFDQEYDMDAELLLADMEFNDDDTPENIRLKESVIELYNARLDERIRRKKFVIERGLLDLKNVQKTERRYSKEEREIVNKCKIFARFHSKDEHERFVNGLLKERLIREAIEQLKYFRSKGLTHLDQVEKFIETNKVKTKQMFDKNNFQSNKRQEKVNGKWTHESLNELQELIQDPEVKLHNGKSLSNRPQLSASNQNGAGDSSSWAVDPKWASLSTKEKTFIDEVSMKPSTYVQVKRQIQLESVKNKSIRQAILLANVQKAVGQQTSDQVTADSIERVFDFCVKVNLIGTSTSNQSNA